MASNFISQDTGNKKISVAIATYNGERYIAELIESIVSQTLPPTEIVCVDDASTDGTVAILKEMAGTSAVPIKVIERKSNVGIIQNFLCSFENCTGDYIAYCDQDDVWLEDRLAQLSSVIADNTVHLVCSPSLICDGELRESGLTYYDIKRDMRLVFPTVFNRMHAWGHQMFFSREVVFNLLVMYQKSEFEFSRFGCCLDFTIPFAASLSGDMLFQKTPQLKFRRHSGSTSEAGHNMVGTKRNVRERAIKRLEQVEAQARILEEALEMLDWMALRQGKEFSHINHVYQQELNHTDFRLKILREQSIVSRLAGVLDKAYIKSLRQNRNGRAAFKEALIDTIAAISL